jgi:hypothetical protein
MFHAEAACSVTISSQSRQSGPVNPTCLQTVNALLPILGTGGVPMLIYPVPAAVTQAKVQLVTDQTAKAPPSTINEDVLQVYAAKSDADRDALVDIKA